MFLLKGRWEAALQEDNGGIDAVVSRLRDVGASG
jgi:hypothetical protein